MIALLFLVRAASCAIYGLGPVSKVNFIGGLIIAAINTRAVAREMN